MKQRKIALSLAVRSPSGSFCALHVQNAIPRMANLDAIDRSRKTTNLGQRARCSITELSDEGSVCHGERRYLEEGGWTIRPRLPSFFTCS